MLLSDHLKRKKKMMHEPKNGMRSKTQLAISNTEVAAGKALSNVCSLLLSDKIYPLNRSADV